MMVYDDIFEWEGWGGQLKLANGRCRLRIYDLNRSDNLDVIHLRPILVVLVRDPLGKFQDKYLFTTDLDADLGWVISLPLSSTR